MKVAMRSKQGREWAAGLRASRGEKYPLSACLTRRTTQQVTTQMSAHLNSCKIVEL